MELLDVIDEGDHVIGQASRAECHANPTLVHRAVQFTLVDPASKLIMISRRSRAKKHDGGLLCFLGEHVTAGEGYEEAVRRGVQEELGVAATASHEAGEHIFAEATSTERVKFYLVDAARDQHLSWDPDEIEEVLWVTREQLGTLTVSAMTNHWREEVDWARFVNSRSTS